MSQGTRAPYAGPSLVAARAGETMQSAAKESL